MRRTWILACLGGLVALACALPVRAQVQNSFSGPTGGIRLIDAGSGEKGTFRLALNTEFFVIRDFFVSGDKAHHFAGNLSLSVTATDYLEVFASAEVTSAWDDSNDPMLVQRIADLYLGLKGYHAVKPWVTLGGDFSLLFPGGVGDGRATFRATSIGLRANATLDLRDHQRHESPLILRFTAQYWFDNTANLTEGIENRRYDALGGVVPRPIETRHLLTPFERFAYGVNRVDTVRIATGFEVPLQLRKVNLHPMLEWEWDIPVNRQGYVCRTTLSATGDGCLEQDKLKAFPMLLTLGLRILSPPKGLAFTVGADIGLTGARTFVQELAPTVPYNVVLGIAYAFDPRPAPAPTPAPTAAPAPVPCPEQAPPEAESAPTPVQSVARLRVLTVDKAGDPVPKVSVTIHGPSDHVVVSDSGGFAAVEEIEPGPYTAHVDDPAYLIAVRDFNIIERQESTIQLRIIPKPSRPRVVVRKTEIGLRRQVSFGTGSDEILPNSEPILLEVADALLRNPDVELVEIQGHTDNRGDRAVNMKLSQQRAESVRRWLVQHGVQPARLTAKGYGPTRPVAPNITAYNRARNRRVQFKILRRAAVAAK